MKLLSRSLWKTTMSVSVAIIVLSNVSDARAFSYTMQTGLPKNISGRVFTTKENAFKNGDEVKIVFRVQNTGVSAATLTASISLSTGENELINRAELTEIIGTPNEIYVAGLNESGHRPTYFKWKSLVLPPRSSKDSAIAARLFYNTLGKNSSGVFGQVSINMYPQEGYANIQFELPVAEGQTSTPPTNRKAIDYLFYTAYKRYPSDKERAVWEKKYHEYDQIGPYNHEAYLVKEMMDAAKLQKTSVSKPVSLASISDLNSLFRSVYGRNPTTSERNYWTKRLLDKPDRGAFLGAMGYQKAQKIKH